MVSGYARTAPGQFPLDTSRPNIARVYDYWLGGKDSFAADRAEADRLLAIWPPMARLARENRQFLSRAVAWLAEQGIRQFLDIGSGLPTVQNTHETAQAIDPSCRVVYVDNDPVVVNHAKVLLSGHGVDAITGDLREPDTILGHPITRQLIRPHEPTGLILALVLHFLDAGTAAKLMREYANWLPDGGYVVVSVGAGDQETGEALAREYTPATLYNHSPGQVAALFDGLDIIDPPGLADARDWYPGKPVLCPGPREAGRILAGVACKPHPTSARARRAVS
jgi:O-methyltransferase involved in polyketide biosynthesis